MVGGGDYDCRVEYPVWPQETTRDPPWRPQETTEVNSRAQILAQDTESSPLTTPPGTLKLRFFGEKNYSKFRGKLPNV